MNNEIVATVIAYIVVLMLGLWLCSFMALSVAKRVKAIMDIFQKNSKEVKNEGLK